MGLIPSTKILICLTCLHVLLHVHIQYLLQEHREIFFSRAWDDDTWCPVQPTMKLGKLRKSRERFKEKSSESVFARIKAEKVA